MKRSLLLYLTLITMIADGALSMIRAQTSASGVASPVVSSSGLTLLPDIEYGREEGVPLLLNLTIPNPKPRSPVPAIICLHGGGWGGGTREDMMSQCKLVAQNGYVGASVEYRLAGRFPFPAQLQDCKCAVRFLRAHAVEYGIDPQRIGFWGCSAGGHLAAMMGLTEGIEEFEGNGGNAGVSSATQMVVDCFGPTDLQLWQETVNKFARDPQACRLFAPFPPRAPGMEKWWENFSLEKDPNLVGLLAGKAVERAKWASPITYANRKGNIPPFLFVHGSLDTWVPVQQSILLANALETNHVAVTFLLKINMGHDDAKAFPEIVAYIKQTFPNP